MALRHNTALELAPGSSPSLIVIQPTPFCNLNCDYCYLPNRTQRKRITITTIAEIFRKLFASGFVRDDTELDWHAGEPLVMGWQFYDNVLRVLEQVNPRNISVQQIIQTNATLLDQTWCDFIRSANINIGVSLDGPEDLHDYRRRDWRGQGTFRKTMKGVRLLQDNEIPFSTIAVLTDRSIEDADRLWNFFIDNDISNIAFNIEEIEGVNINSSLQRADILPRFKRFFRRLLELWYAHPQRQKLRIREIDFLLSIFLSSSWSNRASGNTPLAILSFDCDGNVSTFSPELLGMTHPRYRSLTFGNILDSELCDIFETEEFLDIAGAVRRGVRLCKDSCDYFPVCGGGPPANKLSENGTFESAETLYCRLRTKATMDVALEFFERHYEFVTQTGTERSHPTSAFL